MPSDGRKGRWQPFDALSGFRNALRETVERKHKEPMPALMKDQEEILNNRLKKALASKGSVTIEWYNNGYMFKIKGTIEKLDMLNRYIVIENKRVPLDKIINIKSQDSGNDAI